jgi:hypothetical protein
MEINKGDEIFISGAAGHAEATIAEICKPEELPALTRDRRKRAEVVEILTIEWHVDRVAIINYNDGIKDVCFAALEIQGRWYDLRHNALLILPRQR